MAYLNLDKSKLVNLEYSLDREVIRTNRAGSYSSTTIIGCNTRKYHGMLVCPIARFNYERFVLLSALDISLVQHEQVFNLGIHKYQGNHYDPKGHKYLTDFELDLTPKRTYRVGGMLLSTEIILSDNEEQLLLKVTLVEAHSPTLIRFKPFLAFRNVHELTHQNMEANTRYETCDQGIKISMYEGFPYLHMQFNKSNEFIAAPDWFRGIEYIKEQQRGYEFKEDLFVPGYFEMDISKGESIVFSASTSEIKTGGLKARFTKELKKRTPRDTLLNNLLNSAQQFILKKENSAHLISGYHWYKERLRDTLIALPGLMAYQEEKEIYLEILNQAIKDIRTTHLKLEGQISAEINKGVDIPLWLFFTIQEIEKMFPESDICGIYGEVMTEIIKYYTHLKEGSVQIHENGLLFAQQENLPLTWMDATINGESVTWRPGYTVEVNALWYNALCYYAANCKKRNKGKNSRDAEKLAETVKRSFIDTFWNNDEQYLYDYVHGDYNDNAIRPNQIIAAALDFSPLTIEQQKLVVDIAKKELLTPKGLRTLSPSSPYYKGVIEGTTEQRNLAIHQGAVYPWLAAFFAEAYIKVHKKGGISFIKNMVENFEEEMTAHCISTISEYFNGNPPHHGRGAISMAWNVAAVIRIIKLIEKNS
ncbi:amylo-alpha-1,6-glucosidase [Alkalitalea saponilacus]|uniref:Glycogen debranching enzyme, putative n=1 Tax=Alkalitalea saponilacus TaxID=889453 RepID=A0A1T5FU89_9BACT|nr:amylo-alpha-1,6-glucosidase [Alkalitalea saponilacus]ASB49493.1 glycogen debranching protein [Alkalitalea saponilacus]SKB99657.1 glycogen debranching enzyme, putative [Alkalitalea saponilacus]